MQRLFTIEMDTVQLTHALLSNEHTRKVFNGVYPIDLLPPHIKPPIFLIWNKDASNLPGSHWLALHVPVRGPAEYFDSLNLKTSQPVKTYLMRYGKQIIRNNFRLQSIFSNVCGMYVALFILHRASGLTFKQFLRLFKEGYYQANDQLIQKMFDKHFVHVSSTSKNSKRIKCNQICKACLFK